jgi:hypothetical protein
MLAGIMALTLASAAAPLVFMSKSGVMFIS